MDESVSGEQTDATHRGAARWLSVHDDLLRGLTHSLSNRVGTIAAAAYVIELQPASLETTAATLRAESERLETLLQLFRLLPRRVDAAAEPVIPTDVAAQALALQEHHPDQRDRAMTIVLDGDVQPAYAEPGALTLAIAVALGAAQRIASREAHIELTIASTTDEVRLTARGTPTDQTLGVVETDSRDIEAINWLVGNVRGYGEAHEAGATVVVPTLQAARRTPRR